MTRIKDACDEFFAEEMERELRRPYGGALPIIPMAYARPIVEIEAELEEMAANSAEISQPARALVAWCDVCQCRHHVNPESCS